MEQVGKLSKVLYRNFLTETFSVIFQLRDFQTEHKAELASSTRALEQAVEAVENNVKWMEDNYDMVADWLNNTVY